MPKTSDALHSIQRETKMNNLNRVRVKHLATCTLAAGLASASLPAAAEVLLTIPAGLACDFTLQIENTSAGNFHQKEFVDKNGNLVRLLTAGQGWDLLVTNLDTSATLSLKGNGAVTQETPNPDGTFTDVLTGHNILILFPTDIPAGPTTTLYVGRVVFTRDAFFNFTLKSVSGQATDICGALE